MFYRSASGNVILKVLIQLWKLSVGFVTSLYKIKLFRAVANKKKLPLNPILLLFKPKHLDFASTKNQLLKRQFLYFTDKETVKVKI